MKRFGIDTFIILLFLSIFLAWLAPTVGSSRDGFSPSEITGWGVTIIFFFYGLRLSPEKLRVGLSNTRLHTLIHLSTFLLFPLLILAVMSLVDITTNYYLWLGIFFMASLPSTVSSSVVMVSIARGNISAAIFNASISSLIGVFLTPLWMSLFISHDNGGNSLSDVIIKLIFQVLIPVGAGILLNKRLGAFAERHKRALRMFDQFVILAIVYTAFCESFEQEMFASVSWATLIYLTIGMTILFFIVYWIIMFACRRMKFNRSDTITALFCGSKKSLVHGTVMSKVIVADQGLIGIILLPIMIYHAMQLVIVSIIAQRYQRLHNDLQ